MLRTAGFVLIACFALSALSLADARKSKPSATVSPASDFEPTTNIATSPTTTPTTANTTTPKPTTPTTKPTTPTTANTTTPKPTTTTPKPTTPTTKPTTPTTANTTTPKPTTPTPKPTTPTPKPTTPTPKPTTPTTANTTTPKPTTPTTANTTTPKPTTPTTANTTTPTTTPTTTSTAAPTITPPIPPTPPVGDYNLTIGNKTCLKAKVALQIRLANSTFTVQPNQTHLNGSCDENRVTLYFNFSQGFINFNFTRDVVNKTVYIDAVGFTLNYPLTRGRLTDAHHSGSNTSLHLFPAKIGHSYSCKSDSLYMGKGLYLDISNDQMQAFNLTKNDFGSPDFCPADQPDYRVAIAVGVVLLVLIIVVVVAYLLSRRRRMEGYQSL